MNYLIERKLLLENLLRLRCRVEDWTEVHGWENMDNHKETKNIEGKVVWKLSDWEFVDNMYKAVYNGPDGFGNDYSFNMDTIKTWNKMWKRYKVEGRHEVQNSNFESEWKQIQQMDWDDFDMGDPAMGVNN